MQQDIYKEVTLVWRTFPPSLVQVDSTASSETGNAVLDQCHSNTELKDTHMLCQPA